MSTADDCRDESQDALIAAALRKAVALTFKQDRDAVTLRLVRTTVEGDLDLGVGFFKSDPHWKEKSKELILQEVAIQDANHQDSVDEHKELPLSPLPEKKKRVRKPAAKPPTKKAAAPKQENDDGGDNEDDDDEDVAPKPRKRGRSAKSVAEKKAPVKRKERSEEMVADESDAEEAPEPKIEVEGGSELSDLPDDIVPEKSLKKRHRKSDAEQISSKKAKQSPKAGKPALSEAEEDGSIAAQAGENGTALGGESGDESEMSVVLDEPQKKKKGRPRSATATGDTKKKAKAAAKPKKEKAPAKELSLDDEKIKTLQGWLLKCGIRKMWSRELVKCNTAKEKIQHLKGLLTDAGMTGQYSLAKAKKIKEERELAAEVEWVQQGATDWGKESDDKKVTRATKSTTPATSGRKLTQRSRGFEGLDFLGDQSDQDSD